MPLIEGVGDEVVQFACVVLVLFVGLLAWWSTNAHPDRYRTVLVMRSRSHHPVTVSIRTRSNTMLTSMTQPNTAAAISSTDTSSSTSEGTQSQGARVIPLQEMDSIVDADMAMLDNHRLHFYRRMDMPNSLQVTTVESTSEENETAEESEPPSSDQIREMDSIVSAMEAEVTTQCDFFTRPSQSTSSTSVVAKATQNVGDKGDGSSSANGAESDPSSADVEQANNASGDDNSRRILIKLKYLNDTLKEVEGSLDELLVDFKRRHFSTELSSECRVRLIFQGRALVDEAATLRACGLHHRAVVHCLVHPKRNNTQGEPAGSEGAGEAAGGAGGGAAGPERAWDLENILMTLVSVALTVVWFFRCEYSNMFTASASVALFGLTVFYSVAIFGLYLSDTFHLDRRPAAQPVPNN